MGLFQSNLKVYFRKQMKALNIRTSVCLKLFSQLRNGKLWRGSVVYLKTCNDHSRRSKGSKIARVENLKIELVNFVEDI